MPSSWLLESDDELLLVDVPEFADAPVFAPVPESVELVVPLAVSFDEAVPLLSFEFDASFEVSVPADCVLCVSVPVDAVSVAGAVVSSTAGKAKLLGRSPRPSPAVESSTMAVQAMTAIRAASAENNATRRPVTLRSAAARSCRLRGATRAPWAPLA